jgi:hypothetical protein
VKTDESLELVGRLAREYPGLTYDRAPSLRKAPFANVARELRQAIDYLRYLEPLYAGADDLRGRAARQAPAPLRLVVRGPLARRPASTALRRCLQALESLLPAAPAAVDLLRAQSPDVVLVSPLVGFASTQADYVRAAGRLGIPSVLPVLSWDNLTNKGLLRDAPDLVLVWNELQRREAVDLHGVPPERVTVAGAWSYDHWFDWRPARSRERLTAELGLPAAAPLVLYVCSSPFIAPDEVRFVRRWLAALRADPELRDAGVVVRPHPQNAAQWAGVELGPRAVVWPPAGEDPLDEDARRNYFDSMFHADALVGINTSALVEAAILRKPVHTVADGSFRGTQEGTVHFGYLGHLHVAASLAEHAGLLAASLRQRGPDPASERFLATFIRPHGVDAPAAPVAVAAIERVSGRRAPVPPPRAAVVATTALRPLERELRRRRRAAAAARRDELDDARSAVAALGRDAQPVLAGPWLGEVGYELLYWIPFLRAAVARVPSLAERLVVVSRGGTAPWYDGLCGRYVDVFDHVDPSDLERELDAVGEETAGYRKQYAETSFDRRLLTEIRAAHGLGDAPLLHPATMFAAYRRLAKRQVSPLDVPDLFAYATLAAPAVPAAVAARLPEDFVAVRLYHNASFPDTAANAEATDALLRRLTAQGEVVLLDAPQRVDDHVSTAVGDVPVVRVDDLMTMRDNLAVQTAVVARARAFVGTYGGFSYLPLLLGVPSTALYSEPGRFRERHLDLALGLARRPGFGEFEAIDASAPTAPTVA